MSVTIVIFSDAETPADEKLPLEVLSKFNGKTREVTFGTVTATVDIDTART